MKSVVRIFFLIALVTSVITDADAQRRRRRPSSGRFKSHNFVNNIGITGGLGVSTYYGDLCDNFECFVLRPSASFGGQYRINGRLTARGQFTYAMLSGNDANSDLDYRGLSFRSNIFEFNAVAVYDIFEFYRMYLKRHKIMPYVFAGVAVLHYNPQAKYDGKWYNLRPLETEGNRYSSITFAVPYGIGARYSISPFTSIGLEAGYRWTFTDYLDDVSTKYVDNSSLSGVAAELADRSFEKGFFDRVSSYSDDGEHIRAGSQRGNSKRNDGYFVFQVTIEHALVITRQHYNVNKNKSRFRVNKSRVRFK